MRIKIIGENTCARATRHLLRQAGFAVTEFLPAEVITQAPHSGYAITIDLAPASHTPDLTSKPDHSTQGQPAPGIGEASPADGGASPPTAPCDARDNTAQAEACAAGLIHFDSVDCALEAAILRHVTQLAVTPVVVDRAGGVVHSERELRIVIPRSDNAKADEAAAVAVEFGVLRGLLDLTSPPARAVSEDKSSQGASGGRKKWWMFGIVLLAGSLLALTGSLQASPRRVVEGRGADGAFLHLEAALAPAQGQFGAGQMNLALIGGEAVSSSLYDSGNTALKVNCVVGCGAASGFTDNSAFTAGAASETNIGGVFNDGLSTISSGNAAAARITSYRALHVNLRNASGTEIGTASNPVRTDPTGTTTQPVQSAGNGTVLSGQQAVTGSAVMLATNTIKTVCIKALAANTINVYVGPSGVTTSAGMELAPGNSYCAPATNTNLFYVIASTTGASVSWIASN
jgi:hypothetical protein